MHSGRWGSRAATLTAPPTAAEAAPQTPSTANPSDPAQQIRLTVSERARTVTYVATAATLATVAEHGVEEARGAPFGTYVDYILDDKVR